MTGIVEGLLCLVILYLLRSVAVYIQDWENSETQKHLPMRKLKEDNEF